MALDYPPGGGVNSVPEYQISSVPYSATGLISAIRTGTFDQVKTAGGDETISFIRFPRVTRWIYIKVTNGTALPIYFNEIDAADEAAIHAYTVAGNTETLVLPWRVQKLYFHSSDVGSQVSIAAGLTTVPGDLLSGSIEAFTANHI